MGGDCRKCGARRIDSQLGLEPTPDAYVAAMTEVFREVRRVLRPDGTLWLNLGDSYCGGNTGNQSNVGQRYGKGKSEGHVFRRDGSFAASIGLKPKDLVGIPWRMAFALQADGWYLRSDIIWSKPNPMPESVTDRPTKAHEYVFLLTKSARYRYNAAAVSEPASYPDGPGNVRPCKGADEPGFEIRGNLHRIGPRETRNARTVWELATQPYPEAHFATFPEALVERCLKAGTKPGDLVLDPFCGSGTTGAVALRLGCSFVGIELNESYVELARRRLVASVSLFATESPSLLVEQQ